MKIFKTLSLAFITACTLMACSKKTESPKEETPTMRTGLYIQLQQDGVLNQLNESEMDYYDIAYIDSTRWQFNVPIGFAGNFITTTDLTHFKTAYTWGNHAGLYRPISYVPSWLDITGKPSTYTPAAHTHSASDITGLPSAPGISCATAYGTGTAYTLTATSQKVNFGTTSPSITLPAAGTYLIIPNLKLEYSGLTTLAVNTCNFKLRRTNNTPSDIANATTNFNVPVVTLLSATGGDVDIQPVIYTTTNTNDVIEMWGNRGASGISLGNINVGEASIVAFRIF